MTTLAQTTSAGSPVTLRAGWREMFATEHDAVVFARLAVGDRFEESRVRVRPLGTLSVPVALRTGADGGAGGDARAFEAAFAERRSLPPFWLPRGARVLDLGCGAGNSCAALAARDPLMRVLGVELDAASAAFAAEAVGEFAGRVRVMHGAAWGETGSVVFGGDDAWARRVVNLDAYPGLEPVRPLGTVAAFSMSALLDACAGEGSRVDHIHMDIAGSEAAVFDQPARWLSGPGGGRVGSIRVHVSMPAKREKIESRLVEQGLIVRLDPRDDSVVTGMTRAFAAEQARFARDSAMIEAPPPPC